MPCLIALDCGLFNPSIANGTSLFVVMHFASGIAPDQVRVTVTAGGAKLGSQTYPTTGAGALVDPQSLRVLLADPSAGSPVQVSVDGLHAGKVIGSDGAHPTPVLGREIEVDLTLGRVRTACPPIFQAIQSAAGGCLGGAATGWAAFLPADVACARIEASVAFGNEDFDDSQVTTCAETLSNTSCSTFAQMLERAAKGQFNLFDLPCSAVTARTPVGGPCLLDWDCQGGWCDTSSTCPGSCRALVSEGSACIAAADRCVQGTACANNVCARYGLGGAACGASLPPCEPSQFYCSSLGACAAKQTAGPCAPNPNMTVASASCALKYDCFGPDGGTTCQPTLAAGRACPYFNGCELFDLCTNGSCATWPSTGSCVGVCLGSCCSGLGQGTCGTCQPRAFCGVGSLLLGLFLCAPLEYCDANSTCAPYICPGPS